MVVARPGEHERVQRAPAPAGTRNSQAAAGRRGHEERARPARARTTIAAAARPGHAIGVRVVPLVVVGGPVVEAVGVVEHEQRRGPAARGHVAGGERRPGGARERRRSGSARRLGLHRLVVRLLLEPIGPDPAVGLQELPEAVGVVAAGRSRCPGCTTSSRSPTACTIAPRPGRSGSRPSSEARPPGAARSGRRHQAPARKQQSGGDHQAEVGQDLGAAPARPEAEHQRRARGAGRAGRAGVRPMASESRRPHEQASRDGIGVEAARLHGEGRVDRGEDQRGGRRRTCRREPAARAGSSPAWPAC